jgi:hypothetical protein
MELMEVYHEAMVTWIIARVTSGKCEGAEFVFGLIESAIRKEATEILLTPVQELDWSVWISVDCTVTFGSPKLPGPSLRTWQSILVSWIRSQPSSRFPRMDRTCDFEPHSWLQTRLER